MNWSNEIAQILARETRHALPILPERPRPMITARESVVFAHCVPVAERLAASVLRGTEGHQTDPHASALANFQSMLRIFHAAGIENHSKLEWVYLLTFYTVFKSALAYPEMPAHTVLARCGCMLGWEPCEWQPPAGWPRIGIECTCAVHGPSHVLRVSKADATE